MFAGLSQGGPTLLTGLSIQGRVIWALILREVRTRFGRRRLGYLWALIEPIIHIIMWTIFLSLGSLIRGSDRWAQMLFIATGMLPFLTMRNIASTMKGSISANRPLLSFPIVRNVDLVVARFILEAATQVIVIIIIISGAVFFEIFDAPNDIPRLGVAVAAALALAFGWGASNAVFSILSPTYQRLEALLGRVLYFVSGVIFPLDRVPAEYRYWLTFNPTAHIVDLFREGYYPNHESSFASLPYVLIWGFGLLLTALIGERLAQARLGRKP